MDLVKRICRGTLASTMTSVLLGFVLSFISWMSQGGRWFDLAQSLAFHARVTAPFTFFVTVLHGLPLYLLLRYLGAATLPALTVCGAVGGLIAVAILSGLTLNPLYPIAGAFGMCAGAAFWYGAERWPGGGA